MQGTTVVSDAVLALCCFAGAYSARSLLAAYGLGSLGVAAHVISQLLAKDTRTPHPLEHQGGTSGVLRFAGFKNVIPYHDFLSEWAAQTGVPALFLAFQGATMSPAPGVWPPTDFAAKGLGVLLAYALGSRIALPKDKRNRFNTLVAAAPLFYVIRAAITNKSPITALGAAMFLGSAAVGTTGRVGGFLRVDVFHYVLSGAVITLSLALNQQMF